MRIREQVGELPISRYKQKLLRRMAEQEGPEPEEEKPKPNPRALTESDIFRELLVKKFGGNGLLDNRLNGNALAIFRRLAKAYRTDLRILDDKNPVELRARAINTNASQIELFVFSKSRNAGVRISVAANERCSGLILGALALDPNEKVRNAAARSIARNENMLGEKIREVRRT